MEIKRGILTVYFVVVAFGFLCVCAQKPYSNKNLNENSRGFYVGGQASTNGLGLNVRYVLNAKITLKSGLEALSFNTRFNFKENDISYDATLDYKTGGVFLIGEYYYVPKFYVAFGGALNSFRPEVDGKAVSALEYGDISIPASKIGDFSFEMSPGLKFSPYLGAGYRKILGRNERLMVNLETGLYYMGSPQLNIETTGLLSPTSDPAHGQEEYLEHQFAGYKFYPVLKLNVAIKLF